MVKWLKDDEHFKKLFLKSMTCVFIDSGREPTSLAKLSFDDAEVGTKAFAFLIQKLLEWSGDESCFYLVLRPDPVQYFHRLFGAYPAVQIRRGDSADDYLDTLNSGPEQSPSDAVGINYAERIIMPPSLSWFVHSFNSSGAKDGHLWVRTEWIDKVASLYPSAD